MDGQLTLPDFAPCEHCGVSIEQRPRGRRGPRGPKICNACRTERHRLLMQERRRAGRVQTCASCGVEYAGSQSARCPDCYRKSQYARRGYQPKNPRRDTGADTCTWVGLRKSGPSKGRPQGRGWDRIRQHLIDQGGDCRFCGLPVERDHKFPHPMAPVVDHIVPIALGGAPIHPDNLALVHHHCNSRAGGALSGNVAHVERLVFARAGLWIGERLSA